MPAMSPDTHGLLDYMVAPAAIALPWLLGFADDREATRALVGMEAGAMALAMMSQHQRAVSPQVPMSTHVKLDLMEGALLAASPWLFGFARRVWMPHVMVGLGAVAAALMTDTSPRHRQGYYSG